METARQIYLPLVSSPPIPPSSIFEYLFPRSPAYSAYEIHAPDAVIFIDGVTDEVVTRNDLATRARRLAAGLHDIGLRRGDTVALFGHNSLLWIHAIFGALCAGLKVSPVNAA